jgi:O-antigen ligase
MLMNTGVTTNKNVLGVVLLVVSLFTFWRTMTLWRIKDAPDRKRHLWAHGVLLGFGVILLKMTDSATSLVCFVIGAGLMLAADRRAIRMKPARIHVLCIGIFIATSMIFLLGAGGNVAQALGRTSSLSGRTQIWAAVLPAAPNALLGAGYESFWMSSNVKIFQDNMVGWWHPENLNEAHNGYIEVYLNLGWIGLILIALILVSGYRRAIAAFKVNPSVGGLMLAYVIVSPVYAITEAGFRSPDPMWIFLLLTIISSTSIAAGFAWGPIASEATAGASGRASRRKKTPAWALHSKSLSQKF